MWLLVKRMKWKWKWNKNRNRCSVREKRWMDGWQFSAKTYSIRIPGFAAAGGTGGIRGWSRVTSLSYRIVGCAVPRCILLCFRRRRGFFLLLFFLFCLYIHIYSYISCVVFHFRSLLEDACMLWDLNLTWLDLIWFDLTGYILPIYLFWGCLTCNVRFFAPRRAAVRTRELEIRGVLLRSCTSGLVGARRNQRSCLLISCWAVINVFLVAGQSRSRSRTKSRSWSLSPTAQRRGERPPLHSLQHRQERSTLIQTSWLDCIASLPFFSSFSCEWSWPSRSISMIHV